MEDEGGEEGARHIAGEDEVRHIAGEGEVPPTVEEGNHLQEKGKERVPAPTPGKLIIQPGQQVVIFPGKY